MMHLSIYLAGLIIYCVYAIHDKRKRDDVTSDDIIRIFIMSLWSWIALITHIYVIFCIKYKNRIIFKKKERKTNEQKNV